MPIPLVIRPTPAPNWKWRVVKVDGYDELQPDEAAHFWRCECGGPVAETFGFKSYPPRCNVCKSSKHWKEITSWRGAVISLNQVAVRSGDAPEMFFIDRTACHWADSGMVPTLLEFSDLLGCPFTGY